MRVDFAPPGYESGVRRIPRRPRRPPPLLVDRVYRRARDASARELVELAMWRLDVLVAALEVVRHDEDRSAFLALQRAIDELAGPTAP